MGRSIKRPGNDQKMKSTSSKSPRLQFDIEPHVGRKLDDVEKDLILGTLTRCGGNRTWAADILGISVRTLRNKLQRYNDGKPRDPNMPKKPAANTDEDAMMARLKSDAPYNRLPS